MQLIASRIESVTVFRRGAEVTRLARVPRGAQRVRIAGLPLCLEDESVTAAYAGAGEARHLRVVLAVPEADPAAPPAEDEELALVDAEARRLEAERELLDAELAALERLAPRPRQRAEHEPPPPSPLAPRRAIVRLRAQLAEQLDSERRALAEALREVERRRRSLLDRRAREGSARAPASHELRKALEVVLSEAASDEQQLRVAYFVPGARWAPAYTARLDEELTRATLELRAVVAQQSGEDWMGARLRLSTADRHRLHDLPELPARRIGRSQPAVARGWRAPPPDTAALFEDYRRALAARQVAQSAREAEEGGVASAVEALAPPPSGAMAAPPPMVAPQAAGLVKARAVMPVAPAAAPPSRSTGLFSFGGGGSGELHEAMAGLDEPEEPPAPRHDQPDEALLDYDRLRMPPASETTEGKLVARSAEQLYLEASVSIAIDVHVALTAARAHAEAVGEPPERFTLAWSDSYDQAFDSEAPVDVPSDGSFHAVAIASAQAELGLVHVVVPRENAAAFRTALLDNPLGAPLLPGPVDVYRGRDYLTSSHIRLTPPGGELRLGLGVEQRIKVARTARFREESSGLIGSALSLCHDVSIELANRSGRPADLEVRERVPVAREDDDDVKITERDVSPPWERFEPFPSEAHREALRGGRRWRLRLEDGQSETLRFGYDVRIASKNELVGGNRREP